MSGKEHKGFQSGAFVLLLTTVVTKLIGALFKIPLAGDGCLSDIGFGYFSSAYDLFAPIYSLAMAGLPVAVSKTVADYAAKGRFNDVRQTLKHSRRLFSAAGIVGTAVFVLLLIPFVKFTDITGKNIYAYIALLPSFFFCCVMSSYRGYYEGLLNMLPTAFSELTEALCKLILGYFSALITVKLTGDAALGAAAAIFGITVGTAAAALYLKLYYIRKGDGFTKNEIKAAPPPENGKNAVSAIVLLALPVALASLSTNIPPIADALTVKRQLSLYGGEALNTVKTMYSGAADGISDRLLPTFLYGIKSKAYTLYNLVPAFTAVIAVGAVPAVSACFAVKDGAGVNKNVNSALKLTALLSFPAGMGLTALGEDIMRLLYGNGASAAIGGALLKLFGVSALFSGLAIVLTGVLQALEKQKAALLSIAAGAFIKLILNLTAGIPEVNILGAALSTLACYAVIFIIDIIVLVRSGIKVSFAGTLIKPLISALLCGAAAYAFSYFLKGKAGTLIAVIAAALIYFAALILLNTFDESDFSALPNGKSITEFCRKHRIIR